MLKKSLIIVLSIFTIFLISTSIFAANELNGAANTVRNVVGGAENVLEKGVTGAINSVREGTQATENTVDNMGDNRDGQRSDTTGAVRDNDGYTATRTATNNITGTANNSMVMWVILAVVGAIIIGLVWYYANQYQKNENH